MSHADTYGEGGCATREECFMDALKQAYWEYQQAGGTMTYEEWRGSEDPFHVAVVKHYCVAG